ncbi:hypothetical protein CCAX7_18240 [Capsulimonas corticalis]|uniref:Uncharacterized protein n=1 Tax=Capsulimonas corticalis TaxID=2219043 RepID=A0A402D5D9_9BACT|nr:hypothetical protein [Capsulimonas corticalis]BDI29773.1 hypothetical protein CCAX7_18240 [Capsulimonas corticalis]
MISNHKLTTLLQGRKIVSSASSGGVATIGFDDGSAMTVQTGGSSSSAASGGTVDKVQQEGTTLALVMKDGSTLQITTAEETSSVMVRDKSHGMEYAD